MKTNPLPRRRFLKQAAAATVAFPQVDNLFAAEDLPPVRRITSGPKHHWFGYYDKWEFDSSDRFVLSNEVNFEHRTPTAADRIKLGMVDLEESDKWIELGESSAWGWQQGCMLQWLPGQGKRVIWNDRDDKKGIFVSHILDVESGKKRTIPSAIYALGPDGKFAVTADFSRIQRLRPGYGYQGVADATANNPTPENSGIWRVDLETGERKLIISIAQIAEYGELPTSPVKGGHHWFNHLLVNPRGDRFIFLHRWQTNEKGGRKTRMLTANTADGSDLRIIDDNGMTSHFIWRDAEHILAYSEHPPNGRGFYVFRDSDNKAKPVGQHGQDVLSGDGHCTYLANKDNQWILNDTYPDRENREQHPHLFHIPTKRRVALGHFHLPKPYAGEWRVDTHPRTSHDGTKVVIDSAHEPELGRQLYLIDVSKILLK